MQFNNKKLISKLFKMKYLIIIISFLGIISCKEKPENSLKDSNGKLNSISIFIDSQYWKGAIGDSLKSKLTAPVDGLNTIEPLFSFRNYDINILDGFMTSSRNIIYVKKNEVDGFKIVKNKYAIPQTVVIIQGKNVTNILELLEKNTQEIVKAIKEGEIVENQKRIKKSLFEDKIIKDKFNFNVNISSAYKIITNENKFLWLRKELTSGYMNFVIYEVEPNRIDKNQDYLNNIIKVKDSAGINFQTSTKGTYIVTEKAYKPYFEPIKIKNANGFETKGTWLMENEYMGGPFINYAILNPKTQKYIIIEGFIYDPSSNNKRDMMLELEAMAKSITF